MSHSADPDAVIKAAQSWIGTPYRHQGRKKNVGCDCLGLVMGVWLEIGGRLPDDKLQYSRDWAECANDDKLLRAAHLHLIHIGSGQWQRGDVLVFRWRDTMVSKHLAIATERHRMIHAYERHDVRETALVPQWQNRISGVFRFPNFQEI